MTKVGEWPGNVLRFWFALDPAQWWRKDPKLDQEICDRFGETWKRKRQLPASSFLGNPLTALAGVILFDQFPRNMFRTHADQFSTDSLALAIARGAVDNHFDDELEPHERGVLYMPFQHSEHMSDQDRSLLLFTALGNANQLKYAKVHRDIIARFSRFPHRNALLGRQSRPEEIESGADKPW